MHWEPQLPLSIEGPGRGAQTGSFGRPSPHGGASFKHYMSTHTLARDSGLWAPGPAGSFPRRGPRWQLRPARGAYSQSVLRAFSRFVWSFVSVPTSADARVYLPSTSSRPNSQFGPGMCWAGQKQSRTGLEKGLVRHWPRDLSQNGSDSSP